MQNNIKKLRVILLLLLVNYAFLGEAIPSGNPADPALLKKTMFRNITTYKVIGDHGYRTVGTRVNFNVRCGFFGDYIFSENNGVTSVLTNRLINGEPQAVTIPKIKTCNTSVANSGVDFSFILKDLGKFYFPLWDVEAYAKVGGLKTFIRLPMEAFRVLVDVTQDPTYGLIELQTNYGFSWDVGLKKILWKCCSSSLAAAFEYKQAKCPMSYIILQQSSEPEVYFDDHTIAMDKTETEIPHYKHSIKYKEWAASLSASTKMGTAFIPYVSIFTGNTKWKASNPTTLFSSLTERYKNLDFNMKPVRNFNRIGCALGASYVMGQNSLCNIEGRWGYQRAISVNLKVQI